MKNSRHLAAVSVLLATFPTIVAAQWPPYPTVGVPRDTNGRPILNASAPRTPDGKPDLSGIWQSKPGSYLDGIDPPFQPWAEILHKQRLENSGKDDPTGLCLLWGVPRADAFGLRKVIQVAGLVVILYELATGYRQIFTDGRQLPQDPNPAWMGYSIGHWEGDVLVVNASGFNGKSWLSVRGQPLSEASRVEERFRRPDLGHMQIEVTIDDPKAYLRPWTVTLNWDLVTDTELIEYVCNENEKDLKHLR